VVALLVVIVCVVIRYHRKRNPPLIAVSPIIRIPNNAAAIVAAKKEKELNEDAFDNPSYSGLKENNCNAPSDNDYNMLPLSQDHEVPYDNVMY